MTIDVLLFHFTVSPVFVCLQQWGLNGKKLWIKCHVTRNGENISYEYMSKTTLYYTRTITKQFKNTDFIVVVWFPTTVRFYDTSTKEIDAFCI